MRQDNIIAHVAVVSNMAGGHEHAVIAHPGHTSATGGPDMHSDVLPDLVPVANDQLGRLAIIARMVRGPAEVCKIADRAVRPDGGVALDDRMSQDVRPVADLHIVAKDAIRSDGNLRPQLCPWGDDGGRVDVHAHEVGVSTSMAA